MQRAWSSILSVFMVMPCVVAQPASQSLRDSAQPVTNAQDHSGHEGHVGHAMPIAAEDTDPQKLLADKKESEFNHHLAGFFVALGGAFILLQTAVGKRWVFSRYVWPASFLLSGMFVLVWSDTELWPFGTRQWLEALQHNPEVLQHKTFALLLLGLGWIEWRRVKAERSVWSGFVFPVAAIGGSILLLFHQHEGGMHGPDHLQLMARIQTQHLSYALLGIGIGLVKGLSELRMSGHKIFGVLWPLLMVNLGILLMFYRE